MYTLLEQQRRMSMPEIVKTYRRNTGLFDKRPKRPDQLRRLQWYCDPLAASSNLPIRSTSNVTISTLRGLGGVTASDTLRGINYHFTASFSALLIKR